ncbi:MAG TPA: hypothetical protein VG273_25405 [Bryobacteraceae bacterium]|nr:hypothetical protein [Bryobacteraceae bacterium]
MPLESQTALTAQPLVTKAPAAKRDSHNEPPVASASVEPVSPSNAVTDPAATTPAAVPVATPQLAFLAQQPRPIAGQAPIAMRPGYSFNSGKERPAMTRAELKTAEDMPETRAIPVTRMNPAVPAAPMSFAAKLQASQVRPETPQNTNTDDPRPVAPAANQSAVSAPAAKKTSREETAGVPETAAPAPNTPIAAPAISGSHSSIAPASAALRVETPVVPAARDPEAPALEETKSSAAPLKELSFKIAQPGGSSVQLRMVEHSGELRVAVHTASSQLNQDLRDDLSDLTKKLSDSGVHSEIWRPDMHGATAAPDSASARNQGDNPQNNPRDGSQQNNQSNPGSQQDRGQRGQDQSQRPKWVEELENGIQSASKATGESNGLRR